MAKTKAEKEHGAGKHSPKKEKPIDKFILDKLEEIKDGMDMDFLNRHTIEGIVKDITELQWQINVNTEECR